MDAIYVLRNLLWKGAKGKLGPRSQAWCDLSKPASDMRNKFKHLDGNFANVAKIVGKSSPLFGAVTLIRPRQSTANGEPILDFVMATSGGRPDGTRWFSPTIDVENLPSRPEIWMEAFDMMLDLTSVADGLNALLLGHSEDVDADIKRQTEDMNIPEDELAGMLASSARETVTVTTVTISNRKGGLA